MDVDLMGIAEVHFWTKTIEGDTVCHKCGAREEDNNNYYCQGPQLPEE